MFMTPRRRNGAATLALLLVFGAAVAAGATPAVRLELPMLDGSRFLRLDEVANRSVLLNFWGSECVPCAEELPMLEDASRRNPQIQFLGVAVDDRASARRFLARLAISYPQLIATTRPEVVMRRLGNPTGALPYTLVLDRQHHFCRSRLGQVDAHWIEQALVHCNV
jgi:thiol-disulfide isomerase/thioredoxin